MLGEKRGYWGKWVLGESGVPKRNKDCGGKSVGEMQMLGEAGCWGKGASEENGGCEEQVGALGAGDGRGQRSRGVPGCEIPGAGTAVYPGPPRCGAGSARQGAP